jgi:hypothetical protein
MADYHEDNASFMMYKEWEELFESLDSMEEAGELIMALFAFAKRGEIAEFRGALKMAFIMMSNQLERDGAKWERNRQKNIENGKKGGRPRKPMANEETERFSEETEKTEGFLEKPKKPVKVKDKVKVEVEVKEKISSNAEAFEKVWAQYPKREGRKDALAAFEKAIKKGTTVEQIENGIQAYCEHIKKCNIERQYIKQGSTYFRGEHWNDVYDDSATAATTAEPKKKTSYDLSKVIPAIPTN